ncbi:MAG: GTP pyrophosphokinase family protein [Clostridiales bacterium]|nr:GTP pyrophosphokinase family protein [Clostridiales bacterium]
MENVYGEHYGRLIALQEELQSKIALMDQELERENDSRLIDHVMVRLKSEESVLEKCAKRGLTPTPDVIVTNIHDIVGIRIVSTFLDDTLKVIDAVRRLPSITIVEEKDYISNAKPNGYRSYHMIVRNEEGYLAEIQIRTISMDTWAALEHDIKYKKDIKANKELITSELKRCADELASTDISMQTIRNMINGQI